MTDRPRALLLSERNAEIRKFHGPQYEFEDVVHAVDSVGLVAPSARPETPLTRLGDRVRRASGRPVAQPALRPTEVTGLFDLFFAVFTFAHKTPNLEALRGLRERCDKAVCFIVELFTEHVERDRAYLELLGEFGFDRILVMNPRPRDEIARLTGAPVEFMPLGVDAVRFAPVPLTPARTIDFYQFGRRSPVTHAAALEMARRDGAFYVYDTVFNVPLEDHATHRELMAEHMKRSRYFFSYRPGEDLDRGRNDDVLSSRYFEAAAGGAVLLGSHPRTPEYEACFGWPDSTIEIPYEARDLREIVADLDSQPERLARARAHNVVNSLRRHDWVHRWAQVLDAAGLPHTEAMTERMARLEDLAAMAEAAIAEQGEIRA